MKKTLRAVLSVLSAMVGVQKHEKLKHDFDYAEQSGPLLFIIVGVVMTALFVLSIIGVVHLVLP